MKALTLKKIEGVYHTPVFAKGRTKWISTGCKTRDEAERVLAESGVERLNQVAKAGQLSAKAIGQILTGGNLTINKALMKFEQAKKITLTAKSIVNTIAAVQHWMEAAGTENAAPSSITPEKISDWINDPKLGWKLSTRKQSLGCLRTFFAYMADNGWIVADPSQVAGIDYDNLSHEEKEHTEKNPFTKAEVERLISALRKDWELSKTGQHGLFRDADPILFWLIAVSIGAETGLRLSDIAQMEWRSLVNQGKVTLWTRKTGQRVEVPITNDIHELVAEIPISDSTYLFPTQRAIIRDPKHRVTLSVQFNRLLTRLKIFGKSFHSLRHYKATKEFRGDKKEALAKKLAETLTLEQIAALLGHSNTKTTKGYVH
jgi:integrase